VRTSASVMLTGVRSAVVAALISVGILTAVTCHAEGETWRAAVEAFLKDPALPPFTVSKYTQPTGLPTGWSGEVASVSLQGGGYVVIDKPGEHVRGYQAPEPQFPVPSQEISAREAEAVAREFLQRHLPEVIAPGADVVVTVDPEITPLGARLLRFQRVQDKVNLPSRAEVGVRVFDSRVVSYRGEHQPLTCSPALTIAAEKAHEIALANMPSKTLESVQWLEETPEVVTLDEAQHCVWTLIAELGTIRQGGGVRGLEFLYRWQIDAQSGAVLKGEYLTIDPKRFTWYLSKGGTHYRDGVGNGPEPFLFDTAPVFSPDGRQVLFSSTRPREGYPAWSRDHTGLFVINTDGTGLRCPVPGGGRTPRWSPDGRKVAFDLGDPVIVADVATGDTVTLKPAPGWSYCEAVWVAGGKLAVIAVRFAMEYRLLELDPANPEAPPVELPSVQPRPNAYTRTEADPQGRLLVIVSYGGGMAVPTDKRRSQEPCALIAFAPPLAQAKPEVLLQYLPRCSRLLWGPEGKLLIDTEESWIREDGHRVKWGQIDLAAKTLEPWTPPVLRGAESHRFELCKTPIFSPDGSLLAYSESKLSGKLGVPYAELIYVAKGDGTEVRQLTPGPAKAP